MKFDTEPIIAWRGWCVKVNDPRLHSITWTFVRWVPGEKTVAHCQPKGFELPGRPCDTATVPNTDCICGIYAYKRESRARKWLDEQPIAGFGAAGQIRVMGQVSLWGKVLAAEEGYRSQFAYPYSLELADRRRVAWDVDSYEGMQRQLRRSYLVDVSGTL